MDAALPLVFMAIMGFALLMYVVLDGYDLGIGMLLPLATDADRYRVEKLQPVLDALGHLAHEPPQGLGAAFERVLRSDAAAIALSIGRRRKDADELRRASRLRVRILAEMDREAVLGRTVPSALRIGAMLETPSLAYAPDSFFRTTDFISVGGNDLKQFFFAADRENELVRRRYDTLSASYLTFLEAIVARCGDAGTPLSFCGEDAGRPVDALVLAALGLRNLSMRPASIGPVKALLRQVELAEARAVIEHARAAGASSARPALEAWLHSLGLPN